MDTFAVTMEASDDFDFDLLAMFEGNEEADAQFDTDGIDEGTTSITLFSVRARRDITWTAEAHSHLRNAIERGASVGSYHGRTTTSP